MASVIGEAFLGKACQLVLQMAVRRLTEEVNMVVYFRDDFRWLSDQLTYLSGFLKDADQKSQQREHIKHWREKIRVISLLAEDIFEECVVESKYGNNAQSCGLSCKQWIFQYRMGRRIKEIKIRMSSIIEDGRKLELLHQVSSLNEAIASSHISAEWKRSSALPRVSVGIESKIDEMLRLLYENAATVVAVVGMGGMGKTHLIQHVYNRIKERCEKSIWLSVSQTYSVLKLQKDLVFQLDRNLYEQTKGSDISEETLAPEIRERLQDKSCLVVLDDLWRAGGEDDLLARLGLPLGKNSPCKIVVSTRSREVCRNLNAEIYEMHCLSDEDSWRLFCVYALEGSEEIGRPQKHLEELGHQIVGECGNLPLAIKTIAASLAKSRVPWESRLQLWESKLQQLQGIQGIANVNPIMPILRLSYDALPALLKQCFAYLSFFPEDEEIDPEYLVSLWIGEGFIPAGEGQQEAAWDCLYQLANLCLLQLWEDLRFHYDNRRPQRPYYRLTKHCRVHDLLLDLAINVSRQNKCVFSIEEASIDASAAWCRILLAKKDINNHDISENHPVCLRTFLLSQNWGITNISADLFTAMRGLRVLDLSGTQIRALPQSIGKMKLLKVLNIENTAIFGVRECVRHLKSLRFLTLSFLTEELPVWISELKCLEHLQCEGVSKMPTGISQLASLRVLRSDRLRLSSPEDEEELMRVEDLAKMTQLQELCLVVSDERVWQGVVERILPRLVKMRRLGIFNDEGMQWELREKMVAMKHLESLRLIRFVVPSWISGLANLRELDVKGCDCGDYSEWERMANLVSLTVIFDERCRELPESFGKAGGFPQLRFLTIDEFDELEEVSEWEEGAMACLEELVLVDCPKVKKVGEGLKHLKRLKLFSYQAVSETNKANKKFEEGGELWHEIKSINPLVNIVTWG